MFDVGCSMFEFIRSFRVFRMLKSYLFVYSSFAGGGFVYNFSNSSLLLPPSYFLSPPSGADSTKVNQHPNQLDNLMEGRLY
jgi:hypothetical protein